MVKPDKPRPLKLIAVYFALAFAWLVFSQWLAPPYMAEKSTGEPWATIRAAIKPLPGPFLTQDLGGCWRDFSAAVLAAWLLHLSIVLILRHFDLRETNTRPAAELRANRRMSLWLAFLSLVFLAVTLLFGAVHDYYFYLQMWYEVRRAHDPWFLVNGIHGLGPLNAYGPLFNTMAGLASLNSLAPKLFFAYTYILFAIIQIKLFAEREPLSFRRAVILSGLFWNPFPWVEIAMQGHFDILVAVCCVGAVTTWVRKRDTASALCLASGVLLKYLPIVLLPFLAFDRGRPRAKFIVIAVTVIMIGIGASYLIWGESVFAPITFAARRRSVHLSIFAFLNGRYSPIHDVLGLANYDDLSPFMMVIALAWEWSWYRRQRLDVEAAAAIAVMTMVLFHRTGYPQYHMVPLAMGANWTLRHWTILQSRTLCGMAIGSYFVWLSAFDVYYALASDGHPILYWGIAREVVGLPAFLFGLAFIIGLARAAESSEDDSGSGLTIVGPEVRQSSTG